MFKVRSAATLSLAPFSQGIVRAEESAQSEMAPSLVQVGIAQHSLSRGAMVTDRRSFYLTP
jgi:hypothetical protein